MTLIIALTVADLPPEIVPILMGVLVFAVVAFVVHPSPWRAKFQRVARPSLVLPSASALSSLWAVLALLWGVAFVAAVEREARASVSAAVKVPSTV